FGGLVVVAGNAQAVAVNLAQQRHRLEVVFFLGPLGRDPKGGEIVAALESPEGEIGLVSGSGPRRQGGRNLSGPGFCRTGLARWRLGGGSGRRLGQRLGDWRGGGCEQPARRASRKKTCRCCPPARIHPTASERASRPAASARAAAGPR